jgi:orotate phosphoribosyltransferase
MMPGLDAPPPATRHDAKLGYQFVDYRGLDDLERALQVIAMQLPRDVGLVVGIPRSGLLAASVLALQLNLPMTDVTGFLEGRLLSSGRRPRRSAPGERGRAVVIDDSVNTGAQLREVREQVKVAGRADEVLYAAPYVTRRAREEVDLFGELLEVPRLFAWNILHHPGVIARSCLDIDGVLCLDPTDDENDDGDRYRAFLGRAQPLFLPTTPVGWIVTSRLERWRPETERWLAEHDVRYGELVMLDLATAEERRAAGAHARHKADVYTRTGAQLFIESDYPQAVEIAARSGRQVFAVDRREMVYPSPRQAAARAPEAFLRSIGRVPPAQTFVYDAKASARRLVGPRVVGAARRALRRA